MASRSASIWPLRNSGEKMLAYVSRQLATWIAAISAASTSVAGRITISLKFFLHLCSCDRDVVSNSSQHILASPSTNWRAEAIKRHLAQQDKRARWSRISHNARRTVQQFGKRRILRERGSQPVRAATWWGVLKMERSRRMRRLALAGRMGRCSAARLIDRQRPALPELNWPADFARSTTSAQFGASW
ncbi:hypothetical protein ACVWW5_007056 [Bradyrhizobium sp. LM3.4]